MNSILHALFKNSDHNGSLHGGKSSSWQEKRDVEVTMIWPIFIMVVLGFREISLYPFSVLSGWARVLGL
jgi:hypothetical protein